jgi:hypothetical protein
MGHDFRALPGTEEAQRPAFSPAGDWLVYEDASTGELRKAPVAGGTPLPLGVEGTQASWGDDGAILYVGEGGQVFQVPERGGSSMRWASTAYGPERYQVDEGSSSPTRRA